MARLHEHNLARTGIAKRRGAWSTWGAPQTWGACLIRTDDVAHVDALRQCDAVTRVEDVTDAVLSKSFSPPARPWSLLVESPHQPWATFADECKFNEALNRIIPDFSGLVLRTGEIKDSCVVYVRLWRHGEQLIEFATDGMGWPVPPEDVDDDGDDEDCRSIFDFESSLYPPDFPHSFDRVEKAHQQLVIDQDAYVSGIWFGEGQLCAHHGHTVAVQPENVSRVSLVTLKPRP